MRSLHTRWRIFIVVVLCLAVLAPLAPQTLAQESVGDSPEERVLREMVATLGWPDTVRRGRLYELEPDDETLFILWPPSAALRYLLRTKVSADNGGSYEKETIQYARILALGKDGGRYYIDKMVENGLPHSSYQGREGIVMRVGDQLCDPGGLLGYIIDILREFITAFLEELGIEPTGEMACPEAAAGLIAWTCGSHTFVVRDDTGTGAEDAIAAALYLAAQNHGLCDLGDTLVILAGTDDTPGTRPLSHFQQMAQEVNGYYGHNAYGRVVLSYTFMDADGDASSGPGDWYNVSGAMADYAGREHQFAIDAIQQAFAAGAPREEMNFARVIVVYAGPSQQATHDAPNPAPMGTLASHPPNNMFFEIEVGPADAPAMIYPSTLILVAEEDGLGLWVHEVGHSLYSRHLMFNRLSRITDRYNYSQPWGNYGRIGSWGVMGSGNWWGDPLASIPVHMCGFSKVSGTWLDYLDAELGRRYTLTALERQTHGDTVLRVDDPTSMHAEHFFLVEARDATAAFGAPETGVVLYRVTYNNTHNYHVVNNLLPQSGTTVATGPGDRPYHRPTLRGAGAAGGVTLYRDVIRRIEFTLHSESTTGGYSAVVSANVFTPTNMVGASVSPVGSPVPVGQANTAPTGPDRVLPDIDLHAYDDQGRHVGINYVTGEYENQIPGAIASGDLKDAEEWIFVPEGTPVRFEVSAYKTEQFLAASPQFAAEIKPHTFEIEYGRFDAGGQYTVARGGKGTVAAGDEASMLSPDDPSLRYRPGPAWRYGFNLTPRFYLMVLIGAILVMGGIGWIIALRRR